MSTIEYEIIEKFRQLDRQAQQRIFTLIEHELDAQDDADNAFDFDIWWAKLEEVRITIKPDDRGNTPSSSDLVNEVREERDADILRGLGFGDFTGNRSD